MLNRIKSVLTVIVLSLAAMGIVGCTERDEYTAALEYSYDPRTNLCYAWSANTYGDSVANVPCTVEVLQLAGQTVAPVTPVVPVSQ